MDSKTDVPIILTEAYADKCARAIVDVIADRGNLRKASNRLYRVQVFAGSKSGAEEMLKRVKAAGFDAFIKAE